MTKSIAAILFDLHNTLIYQSIDINTHLKRALIKSKKENIDLERFSHGWFSLEEKQIKSTKMAIQLLGLRKWDKARKLLEENSLSNFIAEVFDESGIRIDEMGINEITNEFQNSWMGGLVIIRGVHEILDQLRGRYKLGIVSNFKDGIRMRDWLDKSSLSYFNECIVISQEFGIRKPHPDIFLYAMSKLDLEVDSVAYVGDDPLEDTIGAELVGIKVSLVKNSYITNGKSLHQAISELGVYY
jgi:HAD superfamily hydrolase (TIGR01549 family)